MILGQTDGTKGQSYSTDERDPQWHQSDQALCMGEPLSGGCPECQTQRNIIHKEDGLFKYWIFIQLDVCPIFGNLM